MKKIKAAVTGNIGCGKSTFCKFIEEMGYPVIKADEIAKNLMQSDAGIKAKIIKQFGKSAYNVDGLNKAYLSEKIFSSEEKLLQMNLIVHPPVVKKVEQMMNDALKHQSIVFHEAALIYEAGIEDLFDVVILITADYKIRMARVLQNYKFSVEQFIKREQNQIPQEEKMKRADFVFSNNGLPEELKKKAELLMSILNEMLRK